MKRNVFISFYHNDDAHYKHKLLTMNERHDIFIDMSVDTGDIPDEWDDEKIRTTIRDNYLKQSSVTIVLVGRNTKYRKHVDWEIGSSMIDTENNRRSGIIALILPDTICKDNKLIPTKELRRLYDYYKNSYSNNWQGGWRNEVTMNLSYPCLPMRIRENLLKENELFHEKYGAEESIVPVIPFEDVIEYPNLLREAIDYVYEARNVIKYDTSIPFKRRNG